MRKLCKCKGFSLAEALIALGIIIVLLAVSIPLIISWRVDLKMAELDNHAREIFLAAQYQLTSMKADGSLKSLGVTEADELPAMPVDFDVNKPEEEKEEWEDLRYLRSSVEDDDRIIVLIPELSFVNEVSGSYLIEFNPVSASVYGVFYWEKDTPIDYAADVQPLEYRSREERSGKLLGYYGGDIEPNPPDEFGLGMTVELVNKEELYLCISFRSSAQLIAHPEALDITVTLTDEHGGELEREIPISSLSDLNQVGKRYEVYLLLDSLDPNPALNFAALTEGALTPGDYVTASVEAEFSYEDFYEKATGTDKKNSLFAELTTSGDWSTLEIDVAYVRHLRNLGDAYYFPADITDATIVTVTQTAHIDYAGPDFCWDGNTYVGPSPDNNPLSSFPAIVNSPLFKNDWATPLAIYNGGLNRIENFVISESSESYAGLFSSVSGMRFENVRIVDPTVNGTDASASGTLAGRMTACTVNNCGVYLSDKNASGTHYSEVASTVDGYASEMARRYDTFKVNGGGSAGGLCGAASACYFTNSFAALQVVGADEVGGFVGTVTDGADVTSCYASGDVAGGNRVGGFAGYAIGLDADSCYATGDVGATGTEGGFVGEADGGSYESILSYGRVHLRGTPAQTTERSGGLVGAYTGAAFDGCHYLIQDGYNNFTAPDNAPATPLFYYQMRTEYFDPNNIKVLGRENSFPYDAEITGTAFPFPAVADEHRGDWPARQIIETSLVYYERYSDGTYGYYCVTTVSGVGNQGTSAAASGELVWVLDTLKEGFVDGKEIICVEDGYALLSVHNLQRFSFQQYIGGEIQNANGRPIDPSAADTLTVAESWDNLANKDEYFVRLRQQGALTFYGYAGTGLTPNTDYSDLEHIDSFEADGLYLFQLPNLLQDVDRRQADSFYDRLIIYDGESSAGEVISSTGGLTFYYCPHFAKTALNPGMIGNYAQAQPNPENAIIRTPRHLNALGRNSYYWNSTYADYGDMIFLQEADLYFGEYTEVYCGKALDLYKTNVPIGNQGGSDVKQFQNTYDGQGYRIIDYRVTPPESFWCAGLFGEICNATIRNVVMTVSAEGKGYVELTFPYTSNISVVGTLVGASYRDSAASYNEIYNCSVSGYEVRVNNAGGSDGTAVGGLIGISYGDVSNCTAVNKLIINDERDGQFYISAGGLIGSAYFGTVENCYSGGTIIYNRAGGSGRHTVAIGGAIGGILENYTEISQHSTYSSIYSYARIEVQSSTNTTVTAFPSVALHNTGYNYDNFPDITANNLTIRNCYYLNTIDHSAQLLLTGNKVANVTGLSYNELMALDIGDMGPAVRSYPYDASLTGGYPFPAVIVKNYELVHFGDWPPYSDTPAINPEPEPEPETPTIDGSYVGFFYYEQYDDGTYGIYAEGVTLNNNDNLSDSQDVLNTLRDENPNSSGYGIFYYDGAPNNWRYRFGNSNFSQVNRLDTDGELKYNGEPVVENYHFVPVNTNRESVNIRYGNQGTSPTRNISITRNEIADAKQTA